MYKLRTLTMHQSLVLKCKTYQKLILFINIIILSLTLFFTIFTLMSLKYIDTKNLITDSQINKKLIILNRKKFQNLVPYPQDGSNNVYISSIQSLWSLWGISCCTCSPECLSDKEIAARIVRKIQNLKKNPVFWVKLLYMMMSF